MENDYNIINGNWICKKCGFKIKTNRQKHANSCKGTGPRRTKYNGKTKTIRYSNEYWEKISYEIKVALSNPDARKKISGGLKKAYKEGRLTGLANTPEKEIQRREKIALKMVGNKNGATSFRRRKIEYNGEIYKSGWEVLVAKYLNEKNIIYEYEKKSFLLEKRKSYTPDFFIPDLNIYIEVKGYWRKENKENKEKFELFQLLYPDIIIEIWEKKKLKSLNLI